MKLRDIKERKDLDAFYAQKNAYDVGQKIDELKKLVGVVAIRGSQELSDEKKLCGLEEIVLLGHWKALA